MLVNKNDSTVPHLGHPKDAVLREEGERLTQHEFRHGEFRIPVEPLHESVRW